MNQGAFLMKGLPKVRAEFSLTAFAYNVRRAITIVGVAAMIKAVCACMVGAFCPSGGGYLERKDPLDLNLMLQGRYRHPSGATRQVMPHGSRLPVGARVFGRSNVFGATRRRKLGNDRRCRLLLCDKPCRIDAMRGNPGFEVFRTC